MSKSSPLHTLSARLLLFGAFPALLAIGAIVTFASIDAYQSVRDVEYNVLVASAGGAAAELNSRNDRWNNVAATMALAQSHGLFGRRKETTEYVESLKATLPPVVGAYVFYEPNADGRDAESLKDPGVPRESMDDTGRFVGGWYTDKASGAGAGAARLRPTTGLETLEYYAAPKAEFTKSGKAAAFVSEPYDFVGELEVSHTFPIVVDGRFAGIAGVDRALDTLTQIADEMKSRFGADIFILSAGRRFIAATTVSATDRSLLMLELDKSPYKAIGLRWLGAAGEGDVIEIEDPVLGKPCLYAASQVKIGGWTVVARRSKSEAMRSANAAVVRNVALGLVGLVVIGGLMIVTTGRAARRVRRAAEAADRISRGDLTQEVSDSTSLDETGQLMRSMRSMDSNLNSLVGSVKQAGIRLSSTATEIAATSKQQEASASTFGAASNQIAAAVKEISATGQDLVRTMDSVNAMAAETTALAGAGRAGLQGMESVMHDLDRATGSIAEKLGAINERSQRITTVITTITKVADQTNILSINAAIEAEKAGEYGAGFLVIAREIRRLADQTASATLDIEQMVQQMQGAVSAGVMEMDRFADQVRRGVRDVASAGSQLTEIIERVNRSTDSFKQVNESMQAQSEGAQQISEAMASLVANANQTMHSVQEFGRAAADLQAAIGLLRQAVAQFKLRE